MAITSASDNIALSKGVWGHVALTSAIDNVSDGTIYS